MNRERSIPRTETEMRRIERRGNLPVFLALLLVVGSVAYLVFRTMSNRAYYAKWSDYDECGLS